MCSVILLLECHLNLVVSLFHLSSTSGGVSDVGPFRSFTPEGYVPGVMVFHAEVSLMDLQIYLQLDYITPVGYISLCSDVPAGGILVDSLFGAVSPRV
ncbi:hypothetical protein L1887_36373 [Cichorium endivia]|nr:hypothetical protein L1887_36373 [Cichorium endivia]